MNKFFPDAKALFVRPHKMGRRDANAQVVYGKRAVFICRQYGIRVADIYEDSDLDTFDEIQRDKYTFDSYNWGRGDCTHPNALCYSEKYMPVIRSQIEKILEGSQKF